MFSTFRTTAIGAAALALAAGFAAPAEATFIFTMQEVGSDVVVNGNGSINTTGQTILPVGNISNLSASDAFLTVGPPGLNSADDFFSFSGPTSFGPGTTFFQPTTGSGDAVGIVGGSGFGGPSINFPLGYMSGASLSDTMTFAGKTFAQLGVTPGTYTWTWPTGGPNPGTDSLILEIGVPEPASLTLLAVGLAGLGMVVRLRRA